jgi:hypothetical protein
VRRSLVLTVTTLVLVALLAESAQAAFYSQVSNSSVFDGSGVCLQTPPLYYTVTGTVKGVLNTRGDYAQVGWRYYATWSGPKVFYRVYNMELNRTTDVDYSIVTWGSVQNVRLHGNVGMSDYAYDYYWGSTYLGFGGSAYTWPNQIWYCGSIKSQEGDRVQARFGYPSGSPANFSLHVANSGWPGSYATNYSSTVTNPHTGYKSIVFYQNYYDFRCESTVWP